eukprot:5803670-Pleurochrysis_carterae.AAC.1
MSRARIVNRYADHSTHASSDEAGACRMHSAVNSVMRIGVRYQADACSEILQPSGNKTTGSDRRPKKGQDAGQNVRTRKVRRIIGTMPCGGDRNYRAMLLRGTLDTYLARNNPEGTQHGRAVQWRPRRG